MSTLFTCYIRAPASQERALQLRLSFSEEHFLLLSLLFFIFFIMLVEAPLDICEDKKKCRTPKMNKLCRSVSIESPGPVTKNCVLNIQVPVPEVPPNGARIRVVCVGACYQNRTPSNPNDTNNQFEETLTAHHGIRDGALFPGFEVSGIIDELGEDVTPTETHAIGKRVILYPYDGVSHGYAEYIVVPDLKYLVPVPDNLPLSVAAILPTGALLAKNAVLAAHRHVTELLQERPNQNVKVLIVGTGGLALWAIRIASHHFQASQYKDRIKVTVASIRDEGFKLAKELHNVNLVQWNEEVFESQIIERTIDACSGCVDIVIDFGTTSRSLHRSLQCLNNKGVVLINEEQSEALLARFKNEAAKRHQKIETVAKGSVEQLEELVQIVSSGEIIPPPHTEFPADDAQNVVQKLCHCEIPGRAILRFHDVQ